MTTPLPYTFYAPNGANPATLEIAYKTRDYAVYGKDKAHVEIKGIDFFASTFLREDCNNCLIENCELLYPTWTRTISEFDANRRESVITKIVGNNNTVRHCSLSYSNNMGLMLMGNHNVAENCIIHDVNWFGTLIYPALQLSGGKQWIPGANGKESFTDLNNR